MSAHAGVPLLLKFVLARVRAVGHTRLDGLAVFAPLWAVAALFSLAGDRSALLFRSHPLTSLLTWASIAAALALITRARSMRLLLLLAALMFARYCLALPLASNNKMIAAFMNAAMLTIAFEAWWSQRTGFRELLYQRLRVVARALLAVMYFYGIFHKINADFLDPSVSCAVALYRPLVSGFGFGDSAIGQHLAIWGTFAVELIALVALYWKRYFAVGLLVGLLFHFVIPISAYSWYMDFSALVFALYLLSIPSEAASRFGRNCAVVTERLRERFGELGLLLPFGFVGAISIAIVLTLHHLNPEVHAGRAHVYQSVWVLGWTVFAGATLLLLAHAALVHLPWRGRTHAPQPLWLYVFPAVLFVISASPYVGLRTEAAIAMFSNLHTEGGITNHLLFREPPYLFDYQKNVALIRDASDPTMQRLASAGSGVVVYSLQRYLEKNPEHWVTYELHGTRFDRVTATTFASRPAPGWFERHFLVFKPVDFDRPKVCTH